MVAESFEIVPDLPFEEYAKRPGINAGILSVVARYSLRTARAVMDGKAKEESDALDFGKAFHSLLDGKREFVEQPSVYPTEKDGEKPWNWNAKFCRAWGEQQKVPIMTAKEIEQLVGMVESVKTYEWETEAGDVIKLSEWLEGPSELSIFATLGGYPVKIRVDRLPNKESLPVIDFKKARSANPENFVKSAWENHYWLRAAFYLDVLKAIGKPRKSYAFVAVEQEYPQNISVVEMLDVPGGFIDAGRKIYRTVFQKLITAQKHNYWPSYGASQAEDHAPVWMQNKIEEILS